MIIEEEQAINIHPVDDTAGLTRDLIIKYNNGRKKMMKEMNNNIELLPVIYKQPY